MYNKGVVVGKFCPLHKGHELLINRALAECAEVMIISYTSVNYGFPAGLRERWLKALFPTAKVVVKSSGMPDDDADGDLHRAFCAGIMRENDFIPDAIFSSEDYGHGFAAFVSSAFGAAVSHVSVDVARTAVPISGSAMRSYSRNSQMWQKYTSPVVMHAPVRVLFIGSESSGKSTISSFLANKTGQPLIAEYGRTLYEEKGSLDFEDMALIGRTQLQFESDAMESGADLIFCDTSPLVTQFYSQEWYGKVDAELAEMAKTQYDVIFFCARDFGYIDDGTRSGVDFGTKQIAYYEKNLSQPYYLLSGSVEERAEVVLKIIRETFPWVNV